MKPTPDQLVALTQALRLVADGLGAPAPNDKSKRIYGAVLADFTPDDFALAAREVLRTWTWDRFPPPGVFVKARQSVLGCGFLSMRQAEVARLEESAQAGLLDERETQDQQHVQ